jgi:hypothetical protein
VKCERRSVFSSLPIPPPKRVKSALDVVLVTRQIFQHPPHALEHCVDDRAVRRFGLVKELAGGAAGEEAV